MFHLIEAVVTWLTSTRMYISDHTPPKGTAADSKSIVLFTSITYVLVSSGFTTVVGGF